MQDDELLTFKIYNMIAIKILFGKEKDYTHFKYRINNCLSLLLICCNYIQFELLVYGVQEGY